MYKTATNRSEVGKFLFIFTYLSILGIAMGCVPFTWLTDIPQSVRKPLKYGSFSDWVNRRKKNYQTIFKTFFHQ